jgi:hypothetical protein
LHDATGPFAILILLSIIVLVLGSGIIISAVPLPRYLYDGGTELGVKEWGCRTGARKGCWVFSERAFRECRRVGEVIVRWRNEESHNGDSMVDWLRVRDRCR